MTYAEIEAKKGEFKGPLLVMSLYAEGFATPPKALIIDIEHPPTKEPVFLLSGAALRKGGREGFEFIKKILAELAGGSIVVFHNYSTGRFSSRSLALRGKPLHSFDYKELHPIIAKNRLVVILSSVDWIRGWKMGRGGFRWTGPPALEALNAEPRK